MNSVLYIIFVTIFVLGLIRGNANATPMEESLMETPLSPHQSPKSRNNQHLRTEKMLLKKQSKSEEDAFSLRLKGQMVYVQECDQMLFLCSPR